MLIRHSESVNLYQDKTSGYSTDPGWGGINPETSEAANYAHDFRIYMNGGWDPEENLADRYRRLKNNFNCNSGAAGGGTGIGNISGEVIQTGKGVYLKGKTPEENAKLAEAINKKIDGVITYDEETGKILGWTANSNLYNSENLDLLEQSRGDLDAILSFTNSENKRLEIQFNDPGQNRSAFQIDKNDVGHVYMATMFETNTNGNWWHRLNGRENMVSSMNHELNHAKNWLYFGTDFYNNDLGSMFKESKAIISTNYLNMYYGWNIRTYYYYPNDINLPLRQRR